MVSSLNPSLTALIAWVTLLKGIVSTLDSRIASARIATIMITSMIYALRFNTSLAFTILSLEILVSMTPRIASGFFLPFSSVVLAVVSMMGVVISM